MLDLKKSRWPTRIYFRGRLVDVLAKPEWTVWAYVTDVKTGKIKSVRIDALEAKGETLEHRELRELRKAQKAPRVGPGIELVQRLELTPFRRSRRPTPERKVTAEDFLHFVYRRPTRPLFARKPSRKRR